MSPHQHVKMCTAQSSILMFNNYLNITKLNAQLLKKWCIQASSLYKDTQIKYLSRNFSLCVLTMDMNGWLGKIHVWRQKSYKQLEFQKQGRSATR